jgi:ABC-type multidrug transport system permease subunit
MQELVFSNSTVGKNFTITDIFMEERMVNELSQYIQQFDDKYDLEKVAMLPDEPIRIGTVTVQDQDTLEFKEYMFICDNFQVELTQIANYKNESSGQVKEYTFMLIIPKNLISEKIDTVNQTVGDDIMKWFIVPFAIFSLIMMFVISYFLLRISTQITSPIIEL